MSPAGMIERGVCEPHAVWIMSMNFGAAGFVTSNTRTPS